MEYFYKHNKVEINSRVFRFESVRLNTDDYDKQTIVTTRANAINRVSRATGARSVVDRGRRKLNFDSSANQTGNVIVFIAELSTTNGKADDRR